MPYRILRTGTVFNIGRNRSFSSFISFSPPPAVLFFLDSAPSLPLFAPLPFYSPPPLPFRPPSPPFPAGTRVYFLPLKGTPYNCQKVCNCCPIILPSPLNNLLHPGSPPPPNKSPLSSGSFYFILTYRYTGITLVGLQNPLVIYSCTLQL